jgi:hypothetical protein
MDLIRVAYSKDVTFGVLTFAGVPFCVTLERPWLDNQRSISCIPVDLYLCKRVNSPKFGDTFEITGVPNRSEILFHKGNISEDTHGCIIVGEQFEPLSGQFAVQASGKAMSEFLTLTANVDRFHLQIFDRAELI